MLFGLLYFVQGIGDPTSGLIAQPVRSLLDGWGTSASGIALFMALLALPWSLKPLLALLSDFVPFAGSRRRSYLIGATAAAAIGLAILFAIPIPPGARWLLLALLAVPTLAIAFTDVLADALMIEVGQPRGLTGRLQSIQWFAAYLALLASGMLGGYFAGAERHELAFLICAGLWSLSLVLAIGFVREPRRPFEPARMRDTALELRRAVRVPGLLIICAITFVWDCNPLSYSVNYVHMTGTLGLPDQVHGNGLSLFAAGAMAATVGYALYCRRIGRLALLHGAIIAGIAANVLYWWVAGPMTLYVVSTLAGFAYMTGSLILLDLAARLVPIPVAATVFAIVMALSNLGTSLGEAVGGMAFELAAASYGNTAAYRITIVAAALIIASCWLWTPKLRARLTPSAPAIDDGAPRGLS